MTRIQKICFSMLLTAAAVMGQTTGKISGQVVESESKEALIGVNIIVDGTGQGAVTDLDGYYNIINLRPGSYTIKVSMIGYQMQIIEDVRVSVNRTTYLDAELQSETLAGDEVIVTASKISTKKDQTSTVKNISSEDIEVLPVESVNQVVEMQAGVVAGHFRGGRSGEVSYLIDGIQVDEVFGGNNAVVSVETEAVQDLEVITGTFNAEYGKAMSGIVNAVTKDGSNDFHVSVSSAIASYFTNNSYQGEEGIFPGLKPFGLTGNEGDAFKLNTNYDNKIMVSGPILKDRIGFFINYRTQAIAGHLNGIRRYNVWDYSNYFSADPDNWITNNSGDSAYVSMSASQHQSLMAKLSFRLGPKMRSSLMYNRNVDEWKGYDHVYKYNPDGMANNLANTDFYSFQLNHMITNKLFYDFKLSQTENNYGNYLFEDPLSYTIAEEFGLYQGIYYAEGDTIYNYVHDAYANTYGPGFFTGGQSKNHTIRETTTQNLKFDMTWQANQKHSFKTGIHASRHNIYNAYHLVLNEYRGTDLEESYKPEILDIDTTLSRDVYTEDPSEMAIYLQDKMEFNAMVINLGLRYDSFDANTLYPSQVRNPDNTSKYFEEDSTGAFILDENGNPIPDAEKMSSYLESEAITQLSPRFGLAYQLGNKAVLHFSYGHFFQMPAYYAIYSNRAFFVGEDDLGTTMGNANLGTGENALNAQKTVSYEIGLWQELTPQLGAEVNLYYRDIYDLLSTSVITTYSATRYGLYINKDYGNVRGLELKLDYGVGGLRANMNYTLQYTKGNSDNPLQTFNRAGASIDEVNRMIPMSWDQRHTANISLGYGAPNYGVHMTGYYNSGTTYSFTPRNESLLARINLPPNNSYRSASYHVDLTGYYQLPPIFGAHAKLSFSIYNLLDRYNEVWVNSETGRAYSDVVEDSDLVGHRSEFNEFEDTYKNPAMFSTPRQIKIGLELGL